MGFGIRAADYDTIADGYDRRYGLHAYAGIERTLIGFVGPAEPQVVLEVGCGTGHWLHVLASRSVLVAGVDPSARMLARARAAVPAAHVIRARAEDLPWGRGAFDRVFCVNAAHHFANRARFFVEARRMLRSGGGVLVAGREPPSEADRWWVYEYFEETRAIDRARYAIGATIEAEMAAAGLWTTTARAETNGYDFISRFFAPAAGVNEDPVTGSSHCCLTPFWARRLGKTEFLAYQASPRGGVLRLRLAGDRVVIGGQAVTVLRGELVD